MWAMEQNITQMVVYIKVAADFIFFQILFVIL